jgi:hypothetical protein
VGLVEMMRSNAWANRTLFDACRELADVQLDPVGNYSTLSACHVAPAGGSEPALVSRPGCLPWPRRIKRTAARRQFRHDR